MANKKLTGPSYPCRKLRNKTYARYPSLSDVERCSREALAKHDERRGGRSSVTGSKSFTGTQDMQTFLDMLSNGWPEGIAEAKGLDGLASDHFERLQFERNVAGAFVNVPAHLQGDPMSMLNPVIAPSDNTRSLTLVVDNCYNCNITSEAVLRYAQEIMRVVAWLSAQRIECNVVSVTSEQYNRNLYYWVTEVKRKGDVLQPERIATCVHTSFFRRGWFAVMEHEHHEHQLKGSDACLGGYGYSVTPELSDLPTLLDEEVSSIVMLPKADNHGDAGHAIDTAINLKLKRS